MKIIKILFATVLILILLAAAVAAYALFVLDPNDYKPKIIDAAESKLPIQLNIEDISWSFFPWLGFQIKGTELKNLQSEMLTSAESIDIKIEFMGLLQGKINIDKIILSTPEIHYLIKASGKSNWHDLENLSDSTATHNEDSESNKETSQDSLSSLPELNVQQLAITQAKIKYENTAEQQSFTLSPLNLEIKEFSLENPFSLSASFTLNDQNKMEAATELTTRMQLNLQDQLYKISDFNSQTKVTGLMDKPLLVSSQLNVNINLAEEKIQITESSAALNQAKLNFKGDVSAFSTQPKYAMTFGLDTLNLRKLLNEIMIETPSMQNSAALKKFALQGNISGTDDQVAIKLDKIHLDETSITSDVSVTGFSNPKIIAHIEMDTINLDDYMPPSDEKNTADTNSSEKDKESDSKDHTPEDLIPVELLRPLNFSANVKANKIITQGSPITDINLYVTGDKGLIKLEEFSGKGLGGNIQTSGSLDVRNSTPEISIKQKIDALNLQGFANLFANTEVFEGLFYLNADLTTKGNTTDTLIHSLTGNTDIQINEALLKGINLSGLVYEKMGDLGQFVKPLLEANEKLPSPKVLRKDTAISDLVSTLTFEPGKIKANKINANMEGNTLSGEGAITTDTLGLELNLVLKLGEESSNGYLSQVDWPILCQGSLEQIPKCGINSSKVIKQLKRLLKSQAEDKLKSKASEAENKLKDKLNEKLSEKLKISGEKTGVTPKDTIKSKEKEVKSKLENKLNDKLNKLFN